MRIIITLLLILSWKIRRAENEICGKPEVGRQLWHIYRIAKKIDVVVYNCFYKHTLHTYSDITNNCIKAFHTSVYTDKWNDNYYTSASSPLKIEAYTAKADVIQNEIVLKSGTKCRYDRGFCYDPKESVAYAVVWEVKYKGRDVEDNNFDQIFYGWVDTWTLVKNNLKYLVFQDNKTDRSFAVQLVKKDNIGSKDFWYTEKYAIIASQDSLDSNIKSTPLLNQKYLPLQPKQYVTNQILRSCDIQGFPLDFEREIGQDYLNDLNNLRKILALIQEQIIKINKNSVPAVTGYNENPDSNKDVIQLGKNMSDLRAFMLINEITVSQLQENLTNTQYDVSIFNKNITKFNENIKTIFSRQETQTTDLGKLKDSLTVLFDKIHNLENANNRNGKDNKEFKNDLFELQSKLLRNDEVIFITLNDTTRDIRDVANNVKNIYSQLNHKDDEFKKEKGSLADRLSNLEQGLSKQAKDLAKCQTDTKVIIADKERYFLEEQNKLHDKYKEIYAKFNLHDDHINKYKNYTDFLSSSRSKLLEKVYSDIRDIQNTLFQNKIELKNIENENINITESNTKLDKKIEELQKDLRLKTDDIAFKLGVSGNDIRKIRKDSDQCQKDLKKFLTDNNEEFGEIRNNLTELQNTLLTKEQEITSLQENVKESYTRITSIEQNCTKEINNWKVHITPRLKDKDDDIEDLRHLLTEKDKEMKALYASVKDLQGKNDYLTNKINKCQEEVDKKLKERDETINRIENKFIKREEKILNELKEKDNKYEELKEEILQIKESMGTVMAV